ncbi:hypothetical protein [Desulfosporosinus sp. FKB]|uniref:hypothetical protein n=1 Tax=Desulfosporosinus sp. FKB TaxID=1969835 RepID=UPI000B498C02|nr:hypothetical protein [Desulfosporosinus sp. FKB]
MEEYYLVDFDENVTSYSFYSKILPQLHIYFERKLSKSLLLDFSNVNFINPLVIPNIIAVGFILKEYFVKPVELYIPWKPELLSYLDDIGFFAIVRKYKIFNLDERLIGGYESGKINHACKTFIFEPGATKGDIRYTLNKSIKLLIEEKYSENTLDDLLNTLTEICCNACIHSGSRCISTFQSNIGSNIKHKKAYISISDYGIGYYNSILKQLSKINELNFISKSQYTLLDIDKHKNLFGILEAIFYRKKNDEYGIFQVFKYVFEQDGVIRVHSEDTQLIFTKNTFLRYINNPNELDEYLDYIKLANKKSDMQFSPFRKNESRLKGCHLEIEIPLRMDE